MKSACIRSFSGLYFPTFGLNTDQKNSDYGHFPRSFLANYQRHKYKRKSRENNIQWSLQKQFSTMVFCEKDVLENFAKFTAQHLYLSFFLNKVSSSCNFIENKTPIKMFSCEFHRIFKNTSFHRTSKRTASQH